MLISDWISDVCSSDLVAGQAIEHYRRARIGAEPPRGIFLKARIDREAHRLAGLVGPGRELAHEPASRRHFLSLGARFPAQSILERTLQPLLDRQAVV